MKPLSVWGSAIELFQIMWRKSLEHPFVWLFSYLSIR
jgi:hypothetical protein